MMDKKDNEAPHFITSHDFHGDAEYVAWLQEITTDEAWMGEIHILKQVLIPWKDEYAQVTWIGGNMIWQHSGR